MNLSKEDKDRLLEEKMEAIRKRNEDIMRRHAEIEADKRNADIFSNNIAAIRKSKPPETRRPGEKSSPVQNPGRGRRLQMLSEKMPKAKEVEEKLKHRLDVGNGPPPDPNFNFLLDRGRSNLKEESQHDGSRRHRSNFGGSDFENVMSTMQQQRTYEKEHPLDPPLSKMEMSLRMTGKERFQYQQWKEERQAIDQERIARQKTPQGTFRREWDMGKEGESQEVSQKQQDSQFYRQPEWDDEDIEPGGRSRGRGGRSQQDYRNRYSQQSSEDYEDEDVDKNRSVLLSKDDALQVKILNRRVDPPVPQNLTSEEQPLQDKTPSDEKPLLLSIRSKDGENKSWKGKLFSENNSESGGFHQRTHVFNSRSRGNSRTDDASYFADSLEEEYDTSKSQTFVSSSKKNTETCVEEEWGTPLQKGVEELWGIPADEKTVTDGRLDNVTEPRVMMMAKSNQELPLPVESGTVAKDTGSAEDDEDESWEDVSDDEELVEDETESNWVSHAQAAKSDSRDFEQSINKSEIVDAGLPAEPVVAEELNQGHNNLDDSGIIIESSYNQTQLDNSTLVLDATYDDSLLLDDKIRDDSLLEGAMELKAREEAIVTSSNPADIVHGSSSINENNCLPAGSPLVPTIDEERNTRTCDGDVVEDKIKYPELEQGDSSPAKAQQLDNRQIQTRPGETASTKRHNVHETELLQDDSSLAKDQKSVSEATGPGESRETVNHQENEVLKMSNVPVDSKDRILAQSLDAIDEVSEGEELADAKAELLNQRATINPSQMVGMQIPEIVLSMAEPELDDD